MKSNSKTVFIWFFIPFITTGTLAYSKISTFLKHDQVVASRKAAQQLPQESLLIGNVSSRIVLKNPEGEEIFTQGVARTNRRVYILASKTCSACTTLLESLAQHRQKLEKALDIFIVVSDASAQQAKEFTQRYGIPIYQDTPQGLGQVADIGALPCTIVMDTDSRIRYVHKGARKTAENSTDVVDDLLALAGQKSSSTVALWQQFTAQPERNIQVEGKIQKISQLSKSRPLIVTFLGSPSVEQETRLTLLKRLVRDPGLTFLVVRTSPTTKVPQELKSAGALIGEDFTGALQRTYEILETPASILFYKNVSISRESRPTSGNWLLSDASLSSLIFEKELKASL
jgi:peroxiredoxin